MTTFKDLQNRTEEAERIASEALVRANEVETRAAESVAKAETEIRDIKAKAEAYILEARARISSANLEIRQAQVATLAAQEEAKSYGHERDEWWQQVFLTALSTLTDPTMKVQVKVAHAAGVASEAVRVRAGLLKDEGMPLNGEVAPAPQEPEVPSRKAKKNNTPKATTPEVPLANWLSEETDPA